jgi:hypothetical protein
LDTPSAMKGVIGIIGCEVLEDEIAYLVCADDQLVTVLVVDSPSTNGIAAKIRKGCSKQVIELDISELTAEKLPNGEAAIVWIKPIALHQSPAHLREEIIANATRITSLCSSILIFYGLCGNAFKAIDNISEQFSIPLLILKDAEDLVIDDCVGAELGGTQEYRDFLRDDHGGYTLNAMWAMNWPHYLNEVQMLRDPNDLEEAKLIFECMEYKNVVMLDTGLGDLVEFRIRAQDFAQRYGLGLVNKKCTLALVEASYKMARAAGH